MTEDQSSRPPLPPFTRETAAQKVRMAEDAWNTRDPERVSLAYSPTARGGTAPSSLSGREAIVRSCERKWARELDYRLIKELWAFDEHASPCASRTSGTTTPATGSAPTATRTGSSTSMA